MGVGGKATLSLIMWVLPACVFGKYFTTFCKFAKGSEIATCYGLKPVATCEALKRVRQTLSVVESELNENRVAVNGTYCMGRYKVCVWRILRVLTICPLHMQMYVIYMYAFVSQYVFTSLLAIHAISYLENATNFEVSLNSWFSVNTGHSPHTDSLSIHSPLVSRASSSRMEVSGALSILIEVWANLYIVACVHSVMA